ncbi:MAG: hypothetical protein OXN16_11420 [Gammaproteobacteria bacterium]|nr:hypothetical protein [Gammaproteobacteria bacterium]
MSNSESASSVLTALCLKFLGRDQTGAGTGMPGEFRQSTAAIVFRNRSDHGFPFGFRSGEADDILQLGIQNINRHFHSGIIHKS